jgi:hypothetical protein
MNEYRKPKIGKYLLCLAWVLWLAGCSNWNWYGPSALEKDYGNSVRNNLAQSLVNPRAGLDDAPTTGLGPGAAVNEQERYNKSFKGEEKKPFGELRISTY